MKFLLVFSLTLMIGLSSLAGAESGNSHIGAWATGDEATRVMIVTDSYWTQTSFSQKPAKFGRTLGGTYVRSGEQYTCTVQFDSQNTQTQAVGTTFAVRVATTGSRMEITEEDGTIEQWQRIDEGRSPLAGTWRITAREVDGALSEMPLRARRTLKILSGTRFQWIAMNVETGEFSGTGGGAFTYQDGKYVETIEFFSRDDTRVGARLEFEGQVKGSDWHHRGKSSKGEPIYEVWTRFEP